MQNMKNIKVGDIVVRLSYGKDVFFKVVNIVIDKNKGSYAQLQGVDVRLCANAPLNDLEKVSQGAISEYWRHVIKKNNENMSRLLMRRTKKKELYLKRALEGKFEITEKKIESFDLPGTVLHIDGDQDYLDLCMNSYKQLGIPANGYYVSESEQWEKVTGYLEEHRPDILILTGHDGIVSKAKDYKDLKNYHNSESFIKAVKAARSYEKNLDDLIIFAGACQSFYEAILESGANFASSPKRVLINTYDPVFVAEKIAFTSIFEAIALKGVIEGTITGFDGIGGLETQGIHSEKKTGALSGGVIKDNRIF